MNEPLWSQSELTEALGAPPSAPSSAVDGISIDTRTLAPGDLFFAILGETSDGHDYVKRAFAAGASACLSLFIFNSSKYLLNRPPRRWRKEHR